MEKWLRLLVALAVSLLMTCFVWIVIRVALSIQHTLIMFSLGMLLAYALDPMVEWLRNTGIGRGHKRPSREVSVLVVVLFISGLAISGICALAGRAATEANILRQNWPAYHQSLMEKAAVVDQRLVASGIHYNLEAAINHPPKELQQEGAVLGREVLPFVGDLLKSIGESVIVLLIAIYFLIYSVDMRERFSNMLPEPMRPRVALWQTDVNRILGGFVRGQVIIALAMGALAAIGCFAIGIKIWLVIGLVVVAASLIPVFGPYLGAIPAIIAALATPTHVSPVLGAVIIAVWFLLINEAGSKILYPKLVGGALGLHAVVVLFVLFAGLELGKVIGVLFAAPLTALVIVTVIHLYRYWQDLPDSLLSDVAARSVPRHPADSAQPVKTPSEV